MNTAEIVAELEARGHKLRLVRLDRVVIRPPVKAETAERLRPRKPEIIAELRRRNVEAVEAEWRVDHSIFVVARSALPHGTLAACLVCGGTWELHGRPLRSRWRVIDEGDTVKLVAVRFVLVKAQAIIARSRNAPSDGTYTFPDGQA